MAAAQHLEARLRAVEDELAIRALAARFSECVNQRDFWGFADLWSALAVWDIGPPAPARAEGVDAIVKLLHRRLDQRPAFLPSPPLGVIHITGDTARARSCLDLAITEDDLQREADGKWRFSRRVCRRRHPDAEAFGTTIMPLGDIVYL